jgi:hypothetical protein
MTVYIELQVHSFLRTTTYKLDEKVLEENLTITTLIA